MLQQCLNPGLSLLLPKIYPMKRKTSTLDKANKLMSSNLISSPSNRKRNRINKNSEKNKHIRVLAGIKYLRNLLKSPKSSQHQ